MTHPLLSSLATQLDSLKAEGLYKSERLLESPQRARVTAEGKEVLNFCANNYLGLASDPEVVDAARKSLDKYGFGLSSVRFICGTLDIHKELEHALSKFLGTDDTILYSSCFDANGGLFETLLGPEDAIISDSLNHASIIDGIRLCKAKRFRFKNNDMEDLERQLQAASDAKTILIATDGVFSMDGIVADLPSIVALAKKYNALTMVDDCHATGFMGENGRGTHEYHDVMGEIDILTGTLGKALGGASGGYTSGRKEIVEWLRQRSRPYLFSNALAPVITATSLAVLERLENSRELSQQLHKNSALFRSEMTKAGFTLAGKDHPIIPVMLGDALLASEMADALLDEGIYVIGFSYPVVPMNEARIRTQLSAAHTEEQVLQAVEAFKKVGARMGVLS